MKEVSFTFPYPVGTILKKEENGIFHIDKLYEYIVKEDGIYFVLMLDINDGPRLSVEINVKDLNKWTKYEGEKIENNNIKVNRLTKSKYNFESIK